MKNKAAVGQAPETAAEQDDSVFLLAGYQTAPKLKNGRTRFFRIFPERGDFLLSRLSDREFKATFRLLLEFVVRDGELPDNNKFLATVAAMKLPAWLSLRERLLALGIFRVEAGRWIDDDQEKNLRLQREHSARQAKKARKRWDS